MASTYITRTPSGAGNRKKFTLSFWIKRSSSTNAQYFFHAAAGESNPQTAIEMNTDGTLSFWDSATIMVTPITALHDISAWYHIVIAVDTTQGTDSNRVKFYINGVLQTTFSSASGKTLAYPSADYECAINTAVKHTIGAYNNTSGHYNGLLTHFHFIDGLAYAPSDFGESDSVSGIWSPKTSPSVTHGTNGFFLKFENSSAMGTDSSVNTNTFTVSGSLTQNVDSPSNNFATWNTLYRSFSAGYASAPQNGNLYVNSATSNYDFSVASTLAFQGSGKFYWEYKIAAVGSVSAVGIAEVDQFTINNNASAANYFWKHSQGYGYKNNGEKVNNNSTASYGNTFTSNDIIQVAYNNGAIWFGKNGTWQNSATESEIAAGTTTNAAYTGITTSDLYHIAWNGYNTSGVYLNAGQGYFGTAQVASAGTSPSEGGIFEYDCPSGLQSVNTKGINSF